MNNDLESELSSLALFSKEGAAAAAGVLSNLMLCCGHKTPVTRKYARISEICS